MDPQYPTNRQDSLYDQLKTVYDLANKAGCYEAADYIKMEIEKIDELLKKFED
jgi:hypothetical protein